MQGRLGDPFIVRMHTSRRPKVVVSGGQGVNGTGSYTFNIKNYGRGLYKVELRITRQDGGVTGYNEKIF